MNTYVIGDIHGNFLGLVQCLKLCKFNYKKDKLIALGDIVDGGDESYECVEELLKIKNLVCIKGNHDDWFLEFIKTGYHPSNWSYGGPATIKSYAKHAGHNAIVKYASAGFKTSLDPPHIPLHHQTFFEKQVLYYIDENNNCFVHGGFNRWEPFEGQRPENYYWDRDLWTQALEWQVNKKLGIKQQSFEIITQFRNIFIGHTCTTYWKCNTPMLASNIYNIDTGGSKGGKLTIMNVETKKYWQSDWEIQ